MFVCVDESESISPDWLCDGWPDCDDGSDESSTYAGCPGELKSVSLTMDHYRLFMDFWF